MFYQTVDQDIRLELIEKSHAEKLFELTDQNRSYLNKWLPWVDHVHEKKDTLDFIFRSQENWINESGFTAVIFFNNQMVGCIELRVHSKMDNRASIGYWLDESFQGKGIITKCCKYVIGLGFRNLGLNRIEIRIAATNKKSMGIPKRIGLKSEGKLKGAMFQNGKYEDMAIFGITASEWRLLNNEV